MAKRFYQQAKSQLAPGYTQQIQAAQSQIPAIQQLYQALLQGLQGQQAAGNQEILEGAGARGMLYSTVPVVQQQQLGQQILQKQGEYGLQQQQQLGNIQQNIAGLRVGQAKDIAGLANTLQSQDLAQQQFKYNKQQANRNYQLQMQMARQF